MTKFCPSENCVSSWHKRKIHRSLPNGGSCFHPTLSRSTKQRRSSIFSWILRGFGISCQAFKPCLWWNNRITSWCLVFPRHCWISWLSCMQLFFRWQDPSMTMSSNSWDKTSGLPPASLSSQSSRLLFQLCLTKSSGLPSRRAAQNQDIKEALASRASRNVTARMLSTNLFYSLSFNTVAHILIPATKKNWM